MTLPRRTFTLDCPFAAHVLNAALAFVPLTGCGANPPDARAIEEPIHVVLLSMDTTRRDHVSFYGYEKDTTPALQRLVAERGVVFDSAVAVHANTGPSHGSILTGLYPGSHGILRNGMKLDERATSLAEILREQGYITGGFISGWSLTGHTGLDRGFDVYDTTLPDGVRRSAELTLEAARPWMRNAVAAGGPFFLFFHLFDPHFPYQPPEAEGLRFLPDGKTEFSTQLKSSLTRLRAHSEITPEIAEEYVARYDGEIAYADRHMGMLLEMLEELGVADRTLIVFLSDHGETLYEREWIFDHGARAYDEQIRVPMAMRLPADAYAGKRVHAQVSHVDVVPTVLDVLGLPPQAGVAGRSLLPLLDMPINRGGQRPVFAHAEPRPERVPEIEVPIAEEGLIATIRLPTVKLIEYPMLGGGWFRQLFDLVEDPRETRNVAEGRRELADDLHVELDRWRRATGSAELTPTPRLSPEVENGLRALGYVE